QFAGMRNLELWYAHREVEAVLRDPAMHLSRKGMKRGGKTVAKAQSRDSMAAFSKLSEVVDGEARIVDQSPLVVPLHQIAAGKARAELFDQLHALLRLYRDTLPFERRVLLEQF